MLIHEQAKIYRVKLPMPFELDHINCYAIKGKNGWSLVDCGLNDEPSFVLWQEFMKVNGIAPRDINGIYLTHSHIDHCELAARLQQLTGAQVYMSALEAESQERFRNVSRSGQFSELLLKNDVPLVLISKLEEVWGEDLIPEQEMPVLLIIGHGDKVLLGDLEYSVMLTPGHADGHLCFYNAKLGILFSGDNILPEISPNISLWPWSRPNPLNDYLESLELCRDLYCNLVLPAHGEPFSNLAERISVLEETHKEKLDLIKSFVVEETTVYKLVLQIYGDKLDMINLGLAIGEVYAHLMFLCNKGEIQLSEKEGKQFFRLPKPLV